MVEDVTIAEPKTEVAIPLARTQEQVNAFNNIDWCVHKYLLDPSDPDNLAAIIESMNDSMAVGVPLDQTVSRVLFAFPKNIREELTERFSRNSNVPEDTIIKVTHTEE